MLASLLQGGFFFYLLAKPERVAEVYVLAPSQRELRLSMHRCLGVGRGVTHRVVLLPF